MKQFRVFRTAGPRRNDTVLALQSSARAAKGRSGRKPAINRWFAIPLSFALVFGGASLWAGPSAQAADDGMVSVTFDDGWASQYENALPILNKYGVPATMYISSALVNAAPTYMTEAQIQAFANRGDEIASHTVNHVDLTTLTPEQLDSELSQSKAALQQMFGSSAAVNFASPYGASNPATTAAVQKYYATQRNTNVGFNAQSSFNPYNVLVQNVVSTTTAAMVQDWVNSAKTNNTWLVLVYHEVGANIGESIYRTDTAMLDAHMASVRNSGLPMVTVRQGATAINSPASRTTPTAAADRKSVV